MIRFLILILVFSNCTYGFHEIQVPPIIHAGRAFRIKLTSDDCLDRELPNYSLFLAVPWTSVGWVDRPVCLLANLSSVSSLTPYNHESQSNGNGSSSNDAPRHYLHPAPLTVPHSIGESEEEYAVMATRFSTASDSRWTEPPNLRESNRFSLEGATGRWSRYEREPGGPLFLGLYDRLPCTSYDCARGCHDRWYPLNIARRIGKPEEEGGISEQVAWRAMQETHQCVAACPGVQYLPFENTFPVPDWLREGGDGDGKHDVQQQQDIATEEAEKEEDKEQGQHDGKNPDDTQDCENTDTGTQLEMEATSIGHFSAMNKIKQALHGCMTLRRAALAAVHDVVMSFRKYIFGEHIHELR